MSTVPCFLRHLFYAVLLLLLALPGVDAWAAGRVVWGDVVGVVDGDTIKVLIDGRQVRVRLYGIDCPEKRQPYGAVAKQFTSNLSYGQEVCLVVHGRDRYRRVLAEVILPDGRNLNEELLLAGLAWWYRRYAPERQAFQEHEWEARLTRRGLWADASPLPPWAFRSRVRVAGLAPE